MQADYIMRMIEQFVRVLVSIILARKTGNYEEAFEQIQTVTKFYLQTDILTLMGLEPDELIERFTQDSKLDAARCLICADLLFEMAFILDANQQPTEALRLKRSSLHLYQRAIPLEKYAQTPAYKEKVALLIGDLVHD